MKNTITILAAFILLAACNNGGNHTLTFDDAFRKVNNRTASPVYFLNGLQVSKKEMLTVPKRKIMDVSISGDTLFCMATIPAILRTLEGTVKDMDGGPLPNAEVIIHHIKGYSAIYADQSGRFSLKVPVDTSTVLDFSQVSKETVRIPVQYCLRYDVRLPDRPVALPPSEITVKR